MALTTPPSQAPDMSACLAHWGLREPPFRSGSTPGGPWLGRTHRAALDALADGVQLGDGVLLLTGATGSGKTLVEEELIRRVGSSPLALGRLTRPISDVSELAQAVGDAFALGDRFPDAAAFATRFRRFLADARAADRIVLLVIEEAHHLGGNLLRKVLDLSTIGSFEDQRLVILLVGEPELRTALEQVQHAGLRERMTVRCALQPLALDEVAAYVRHRLQQAGAERTIFDDDAIRRIWSISRGAPGVVNVVCEQALQAGYARRARVIGADLVDASLGGAEAPADLPAAAGAEPVREATPDRRPALLAASWRRLAGGPARVVGAALAAGLAIAAGVVAMRAYDPDAGGPGNAPAGRLDASQPSTSTPSGITSGSAPDAGLRTPDPPAPGAATARAGTGPPALPGTGEGGQRTADTGSAEDASTAKRGLPAARERWSGMTGGEATAGAGAGGDARPESAGRRQRIAVREDSASAVAARRPAPVARREAAPPRDDVPDPGAIIDWLFRGSGQQ